MCTHVFRYPDDKGENYNPDGKTLTGVCKHCGERENAYGMIWGIKRHDDLRQNPFGAILGFDGVKGIYEKDYLPD